ncbi:MAG: DNA recombination protein RmuC [Clostridiales bacterium]|nr:DNA recombination protein RmuC [Clostridiales bacterium]
MTNDLSLLIAGLLLACVILLIVLLIRQNSGLHRQEEARLCQERGMENLGNQLLDELDAQRDQTMDSLFQGNQHLMNTLSQMGQSQSTLLENMLASVYRGLGEMQTVASGVGDLKKVMTNVKTRGIWGEMQLGNLIRQTLAPGQYAENIEVVPGSGERVEFAIRLPDQSGNTVWMPVDSKFPQESYLRLVDASQRGDAAAAEEARKALVKRIRAEAKTIAEKYVSPPHTSDFALMFLPTEALYAEVLQSPDLVESIQREQRVVITGPGSFSAMLNALQMGFRTLTIEKRSSEVWHLLGQVENEFGRFSESLEEARRRLGQAEEAMDAAAARARTLQRKLKDLDAEDYPSSPGRMVQL